ncbi:MAG TPA: lipocalin family protein [Bacteroidales bacterium]|nr:lipocalin family protein [Bacteroidales bacterium]
MKANSYIIMIILTSFFFGACAQKTDVQTVPSVDLNKYAGKWHEIATIPQSFQKDCYFSTAEYTLSDKGYVIVENRCIKGGKDGEKKYIKGKAFVVKNSGNAKLKVQFFWPFKGDYWIIDLAPDYSYAVVGDPSKKYLWILSRTPEMDEATYQEILKKLVTIGYDVSKLLKTNQFPK